MFSRFEVLQGVVNYLLLSGVQHRALRSCPNFTRTRPTSPRLSVPSLSYFPSLVAAQFTFVRVMSGDRLMIYVNVVDGELSYWRPEINSTMKSMMHIVALCYTPWDSMSTQLRASGTCVLVASVSRLANFESRMIIYGC